MTPAFAARRRAEEFNALVEGTSTRELHDARDLELLELVGTMRRVPPVTARPEFVSGLRERLMAEADSALVPADLSRLRLPERRTPRERRLAALVGGIAIVGATTSVAVASQSAIPGDSLYPIKRALEGVHTGISVGEGSKGTTVLANASDRLDEVDALARQDDLGDDVRIADTLNAFTDQATTASDLLLADYAHTGNASSIADLRDFASTSLDRLAALEPLVPAEARDELLRAAALLSTIDTEAAGRCPTCGGTPIESIPPVLAGGEFITVPQAPTVAPTESAGHTGTQHADNGSGQDQGEGNGKDTGGRPDLPDVDQGGLGPGSVLNPSDGASPGGSSTNAPNPLQALSEGLTGGGTPSASPSLPEVGSVLDGVGDILNEVVDPLAGETPTP
jgi:Domain of unknown function (DUF5667)